MPRTTWKSIRAIPAKAMRTMQVAARPERHLVLHWCREGVVARNWGDKLNPFLAGLLSGKRIVHEDDVFPSSKWPVHYMIGSALEYAQAAGAVVWGTGFVHRDQGLRKPPRAVHAVRGYRSLERLKALGVECPDVVGDPALLLPLFYTPRPSARRYKLGVIPHCRELDLPAVAPGRLPEDTLRIDITGGIFDVVDQICSCDFIASSSLHGLICAHAYGVPARWIKLSDRPFGDGFKYHDFYSSIGAQVDGPMPVTEAAQLDGVRDGFREANGTVDLDRLMEACPFLVSEMPAARRADPRLIERVQRRTGVPQTRDHVGVT